MMNSNQMKEYIVQNYPSLQVMGVDDPYKGLEGFIDHILTEDERETENESKLDIVVDFEEPKCTIDYPILEIVEKMRKVVSADDILEEYEILMKLNECFEEIREEYTDSYENIKYMHERILEWDAFPSSYDDERVRRKLKDDLFECENSLFTHPSLNGTSISEVIMGEDELAFFKNEGDDLGRTIQGQAVCRWCQTTITHVYEMQYEDIDWHWNNETMSYEKSVGIGDTEGKKCGHCGRRLDIDPLDPLLPY